MSTQQKSSGGGRKNKTSGAGPKESGGVAVSEQNNNQSQTNSKKHNNVNSKDTVNNNNSADQSKTEKEKPHVKVRRIQLRVRLFSAVYWLWEKKIIANDDLSAMNSLYKEIKSYRELAQISVISSTYPLRNIWTCGTLNNKMNS